MEKAAVRKVSLLPFVRQNERRAESFPRTSSWISETCGECHKKIYDEWKSSSHHFASFNNQFYRKAIENMQEHAGALHTAAMWCAGCHDSTRTSLFNGRFDKPIKQQIDTAEAHAGLACTSCHAIVHVDSTMGNGGVHH